MPRYLDRKKAIATLNGLITDQYEIIKAMKQLRDDLQNGDGVNGPTGPPPRAELQDTQPPGAEELTPEERGRARAAMELARQQAKEDTP